MSSVIVLDSSDSEDEAPSNPKRQLIIGPTGSAKLIPIATVTTSGISTTVATTKTTMATSNKKGVLIPKGAIKSINIPKGITVTRHSPVTVAKTSQSAVLIPQKTGQPKSNIRLSIVKKAPTQNTPKTLQPLQITPLVVSNTANAQKITALGKPIAQQQQQIIISGVKRAATLPVTAPQPKIVKLQEQDVIVRRKSPTTASAAIVSSLVTTNSNVIVRTTAPGSGLVTTAGRVIASTQSVKRTQAPPLVKVTSLSSTPARIAETTQRFVTTTAVSGGNCFKATAARPLRPVISVDVDAITASATPPLRLLASPPHHSVDATNDPLHLQLNLPPDTTVTAQQTQPKLSPPIQKQPQQPQPLKINSNPTVKRATPAPAASPMAAALPPQLSPSPKIISAESINKMPGEYSPITKLPPNSPVANSNNNGKDLRYISPTTKTSAGNQSVSTMVMVTNVTRTKPTTSVAATATPTKLATSASSAESTPPKRIKPTTLVSKTDTAWQQRNSMTRTGTQQVAKRMKTNQTTVKDNEPTLTQTATMAAPPAEATAASPRLNGGAADLPSGSSTATSETTKANTGATKEQGKRELDADYEELVKVCRKADGGADMNRLIEIKLLKYYNDVHENFVRSRGFRKTVRSVIEDIRAEPEMVYFHLKTVIDELKVRRKAKVLKCPEEESTDNAECGGGSVSNKSTKSDATQALPDAAMLSSPTATTGTTTTMTMTTTTTTTTGNKRTDEQIRKLNRALHIVTKRIEALETAEVDLNDEDSSYLQVERYKKRACQLYEKICDLTGENKNALRVVRKPIQFKDTAYPEFNKTLQAFINHTREFPDYFDVLRMLEHCNTQYNMGLANFEMKRIAHDAFTKVGKLLQARRKTDLYETVTHFTANSKDPAAEDTELAAKLNENKKNQKKISDILEKYAREQDLTAEEQREARLKERQQAAAGNSVKDNGGDGEASSSSTATAKDNVKVINAAARCSDDEEDDDDEDDDDEDEEEDDELDVDKLANGHLSDADSEAETLLEDDRTSVKQVVTEIVELNDTLDDLNEAALVDEVNRKTPIKETTANIEKIKEDGQECNGVRVVKSRSDAKTINNNTMRVKTGNGTSIKPTTTTVTAATIPATTLVQNGKVRSHAATPQKINTVSGNNNNNSSSPLIKQSSSTIQTLKIMSVSSLNASLATLSEHQQSQQQKQKQQQQQPQHLRITAPVQLSSSVPSPYTEIVISDEES